ncbi:MAG: RHS repeat protein, partial [Candidatus Peribacteraceae bacterium]|nr:RHS repeat protein [Candidatus Peribacteraceae bacterium]
GDFEVSTGDYIDINLDTNTEFKAIIKMPYSDVPSNLIDKYLRMYRQAGSDWIVITDWENGEYTGINEEYEYVWAYVEHFSTYTTADASQWDADTDGLTDLTEDTEPPNYNTTIELNENAFSQQIDISGSPETVTYLEFNVNEQNDFLAQNSIIEITSNSIAPIDDLQIDVGNDGTIDWKATVPFEGTLRLGSLREGISEYLFNNHMNNANTTASIPFKFISSSSGTFDITYSKIIIEDITTANYLSDSSSDDLYDGWQDKNNNFIYEREGVDGIIGTADDEIPGSRSYDLDPREKNIVGSKGMVTWNEYQKGINQVNGNLAIESTDMNFKALGHNLEIKRVYNSLNSEVLGPFGYGWQFDYGESLEFRDGFVDLIAGDGSYYEFEDLGDGNYSSPPGSNLDMIVDSTYKLRSPGGSVKAFDLDGKLLSITDKNGNSLDMSYDANYRLMRVEDGSGLYLQFNYDGNQISSIEDPIGRTNIYDYDSSGNLITREDAIGNLTTYEYDGHKMSMTINPLGLYKEYQYTFDNVQKISTITVGEYDFNTDITTPYHVEYEADYSYPSHSSAKDANDHNTARIFDEYGVTIERTYPDGTTSEMEYNKDLKPVVETDQRGNIRYNSYDPIGNQIEQEDPTGNKSTTSYKTVDDSERFISVPEKIIDKTGEEITVEYDPNYNVNNFINKGGNTTNYEFSSAGLMESQTLPNGAETTYTYDTHGYLVNQTDALGNITTHYYDEVGRETKTKDANDHSTDYIYDDLDRRIEIIDAQDYSVSYTYDAMGNILTMTDKAGETTTFEYDIFGRKTAEIDALGNTTSFEYDLAGNMVKTIDSRDNSIYYFYDEMDRTVEIKDALGYSEYYGYDENGNQIQYIDKLGNYWNKTYDELGRMTEEYCPYDKAIKYEYDAEGRNTKIIDRMGYETIFDYDAMGRKISELGAEGSETLYGYDSVGTLITVTQLQDDNSNPVYSSWEYEYDLLNRKVKEISPLGHTQTFDYDAMGNMMEYTNAKGEITIYEYNEVNRPTFVWVNPLSEGYSGYYSESTNISYDLTSKQAEYEYHRYQIFDWDAPFIYGLIKQYDALGRLIEESMRFSISDYEIYTISYEYDSEGNRIKTIDQLGNITEYAYDELNRLTSVIDPELDETTFEYDPLGLLIKTTYPTGTEIHRTYNNANLLTSIVNRKSTGEVISGFNYQYNFNANRVRTEEADGTIINYTYDGQNRLIDAEYSTGLSISYEYDVANNMIQKTVGTEVTDNTYDIENRLVNSNGVTYNYDNDGNMIYDGQRTYYYTTTYLGGSKRTNLREIKASDEG